MSNDWLDCCQNKCGRAEYPIIAKRFSIIINILWIYSLELITYQINHFWLLFFQAYYFYMYNVSILWLCTLNKPNCDLMIPKRSIKARKSKKYHISYVAIKTNAFQNCNSFNCHFYDTALVCSVGGVILPNHTNRFAPRAGRSQGTLGSCLPIMLSATVV